MAVARESRTATLLISGKVLVAGDQSAPPRPLASAELYDRAVGTWLTTASLAVARRGHTATILPDGAVLVVGGDNNSGYLASAERYQPAGPNRSAGWSVTGSLANARTAHVAVLFPNGKVLVAGGSGPGGPFLDSVELYDPNAGWSTTGSMAFHR